MNFVRAFELYERRWGIEVIFKECRGYLGLGKCHSRSYNAQIADTTLCFMMYQMLSLAKRFSEYEQKEETLYSTAIPVPSPFFLIRARY